MYAPLHGTVSGGGRCGDSEVGRAIVTLRRDSAPVRVHHYDGLRIYF